MSRRGGRRSIRHNTRYFTASKLMAPRAIASRTAAVTSSILNASINRKTCTNSLTLLTHPRFQKTPQRHELFRQLPAGQRRSLVESVDLLLDQGEVVQRIEHEVLAFVGTRMTRDHLRST